MSIYKQWTIWKKNLKNPPLIALYVAQRNENMGEINPTSSNFMAFPNSAAKRSHCFLINIKL